MVLATHEKVLQRIEITPTGCWLYTGNRTERGYGIAYVQTHGRGTDERRVTHRIVWEALRGPIPDGMFLDHVCHNTAQPVCDLGSDCPHRRCCNPDHLALVTPRENAMSSPYAVSKRGENHRSKTHCKHGHEFTPENTRIAPTKAGGLKRSCRECERIRNRATEARARARRAA